MHSFPGSDGIKGFQQNVLIMCVLIVMLGAGCQLEFILYWAVWQTSTYNYPADVKFVTKNYSRRLQFCPKIIQII